MFERQSPSLTRRDCPALVPDHRHRAKNARHGVAKRNAAAVFRRRSPRLRAGAAVGTKVSQQGPPSGQSCILLPWQPTLSFILLPRQSALRVPWVSEISVVQRVARLVYLNAVCTCHRCDALVCSTVCTCRLKGAHGYGQVRPAACSSDEQRASAESQWFCCQLR